MNRIDACQSNDYQRVEKAIDYIRQNLSRQPELAQIAAHVGLSPYHFQRLFRRFAGVSPKRFLEFLTVGEAKRLLARSHSILSAADGVGLSGPARLHDQFVSIEAATPGDFKRHGANLTIRYGFGPSPFGEVLVASTARGICALSFTDVGNRSREIQVLRSAWPLAGFARDDTHARTTAQNLFDTAGSHARPVHLAVQGTNFQIQVWNALLRIPAGALVTYGDIARSIGKPRAARSVASAIGANDVGFLIPCHRVIRSSGVLGEYRWGESRKAAIIAWEQASTFTGNE
ncbi:MAG: methylated-DNA--[protein]-cysteine S-methyltransferase [Acidiferrobacteraceae bacterium]|jgi:AraC family transcriptional regulator of adaptative response/methylated-DNA-[protein]-cysteine methyltransferase